MIEKGIIFLISTFVTCCIQKYVIMHTTCSTYYFFWKKQQKSISRKNRRRTVDSQKSRFFCSDSSQGSLTTVLGRGIVVWWKMASGTSSPRRTSPSLLKDSSSTNWPSLPFTKLKSSSNKVLGKGVHTHFLPIYPVFFSFNFSIMWISLCKFDSFIKVLIYL